VTEIFLDIKAWGNSLGVRLPSAVATAAKLVVNQRVRIVVEGDRVIITKDNQTLKQRLALFDPKRHGGEVMDVISIGAEHP